MSLDAQYVNDTLSDNLIASVSNLRVYFQSKQGMVHSVDGVSFGLRGVSLWWHIDRVYAQASPSAQQR